MMDPRLTALLYAFIVIHLINFLVIPLHLILSKPAELGNSSHEVRWDWLKIMRNFIRNREERS